MEEIKAKHQGGSAAFPRTDSTHSESTCFLFPCKIHFCYSVFLLIFAIEFKSTNFFYFFLIMMIMVMIFMMVFKMMLIMMIIIMIIIMNDVHDDAIKT